MQEEVRRECGEKADVRNSPNIYQREKSKGNSVLYVRIQSKVPLMVNPDPFFHLCDAVKGSFFPDLLMLPFPHPNSRFAATALA